MLWNCTKQCLKPKGNRKLYLLIMNSWVHPLAIVSWTNQKNYLINYKWHLQMERMHIWRLGNHWLERQGYGYRPGRYKCTDRDNCHLVGNRCEPCNNYYYWSNHINTQSIFQMLVYQQKGINHQSMNDYAIRNIIDYFD